jgi:hypothetical protein
MSATMQSLSFPGSLLDRGFWLYVWEIKTQAGNTVLYVGRTGDEASPNAQSPFNRVSQHLGTNEHANALRRNLKERGIAPEACVSFEMVAYGPIFAEVESMEKHKPLRDKVAACEKALRDALMDAKYNVLNPIRCNRELDTILWHDISAAFAKRFPRLQGKTAVATATGER